MATKHTQGEWIIFHEFNIQSISGRAVASAGIFTSNLNPEKVHEENVANAKLIAAAPDMLAALNNCVDELMARGFEKTGAYEIGMRAIKKATV